MTYLAEPISPPAGELQNLQSPGRPNANVAFQSNLAVDDWKRLERFLVLGREDGVYRAAEPMVGLEHVHGVFRCLVSDGRRVVNRIVAVTEAGCAVRPEPSLFVLALAASDRASPETRSAALTALPRVCRSGAQLLLFARYADELRGWGRGLRRAIADWYRQPVEQLVREILATPACEGWSHRDLLRLSHPKAPTRAHQELYRWIARGWEERPEPETGELRRIYGLERVRRSTDCDEASALVREHALPLVSVPSHLLLESSIWAAIVDGWSSTELLSRLPSLAREGKLKSGTEEAACVVARLRSPDFSKDEDVHPMSVFTAWAAIAQPGRKDGPAWWELDLSILKALDAAFHDALESVKTTGKRWLVALDVSGSMGSGAVEGVSGVSPRVISAALALLASAEERASLVAFTAGPGRMGGRWDGSGSSLSRLYIPPGARLRDVVRQLERLPMGGTDCALPVQWALERKMPVDVFAVFTDRETWSGKVSPARALSEYRERMGIPAKLVVVGMTSDGFTIADPHDAGMLDVIGFDPSVPGLLADFAAS